MAVVSLAQGRAAVTQYEVRQFLERVMGNSRTSGTSDARYTLVACHPLTGRTHQIRVHLAHIHHPIVGDALYGGGRRASLACPRQFLHAERIRFILPASGQEIEFFAPLPTDLQAVLDGLQVQS
jgi:23S rRNA pseudouridine1911/1915/1917 synthase